MSANKVKIRVAAAVTRHNGKILIAQRIKQGMWGDYWEFPGGKIKEGESEEACIRRELKEELDVEVAVYEKIWRTEYEDFEKTIELHFYACGLLAGKPKALECQAFQWVSQKELKQYTFLPANTSLIRRLFSSE